MCPNLNKEITEHTKLLKTPAKMELAKEALRADYLLVMKLLLEFTEASPSCSLVSSTQEPAMK